VGKTLGGAKGYEGHGDCRRLFCSSRPVHTASASPHELTLVGETLSERFVKERPSKLVGDRAYDSDPLDEALLAEGIEMIAPHRDATARRLRLKTGASSDAPRGAGSWSDCLLLAR
jgi:hypothetical protein